MKTRRFVGPVAQAAGYGFKIHVSQRSRSQNSIRGLIISGYTASEKAGYDQFTRHDSIRIAQSRRRIARIMKLTSVAGGHLLDVGSASGFFGVATREVGFDVTCVEPDKEFAAFGREKYGLTFLDRPLEHCFLQAASFDVVTVWGTDGVLLHPLHSFQHSPQR